MSVFAERAELLDRLEFKFGKQRGRLAATMDVLSDAEVLLGSHLAYCQAARGSSRPPPDLDDARRQVQYAKELVASLLAAQSAEKLPST